MPWRRAPGHPTLVGLGNRASFSLTTTAMSQKIVKKAGETASEIEEQVAQVTYRFYHACVTCYSRAWLVRTGWLLVLHAFERP